MQTLKARPATSAKTEHKKDKKKQEGAMQAGARRHPEPPMPVRHLEKRGHESDLELQPMFDAPFDKGSGKLDGRTAIVTGGDSGISRSVCTLFARKGADIALFYLNEHEDAEETKRAVEAAGKKCLVFPGDVIDRAFCRDRVERVVTEFGRLDVLVNNAAFQIHDFEELREDQFSLTLKTKLNGYFHMARAAVAHTPD